MARKNSTFKGCGNRTVAVLASGAVLLLACVAAQAQTYTFGRADVPVGNLPSAITAGDFNGDGLIDLAVANSGDNAISVLLRNPDGSLAAPVTYATGSSPAAIASGDFNGDGNLDLAITTVNCTVNSHGSLQCSPSTVDIFLGNGDGTFQLPIGYAVGSRPTSVVVADLNADGNLDLAVTNSFDGTVSALLGNGDGTFQPQAVYPTASLSQVAWQSVVVGDFNGDGKLDLAVSCPSVVSVLLGNGDGTFQPHLDSGAGGISLAAADFNSDGKLDLVVTGPDGSGQNFMSMLLGNGDGTFILTRQDIGGTMIAARDLDGDGNLDVILSRAGTNSLAFNNAVAVLLGNGDGTFQPEKLYGTGELPFGFLVMDFNGDGKLDLVVADSGGCLDLTVSGCIQSRTISILLGFGDGTFVTKVDYGVGNGPLASTSADLNNDGKADLATANMSADSISVLLGNGDGTFQTQVPYPVGHLPLAIAAGSFRNNGVLDLVTANQVCSNASPPCAPGTVSVLLGNGDGTFQPHVDYTAGLVPSDVAVGDFRGAGTLDLAVVNEQSSSVSILLGNGDGTFQTQVSYLTASTPFRITVGDFNQDGKLDLAVATAGAVSILLGNGDGTFKPHVDYAGSTFAIATADFNGDGKLDLVTESSASLSIFLGNGDGTFQAPVSFSVQTSSAVTSAIRVSDFNQDGKLDLAVITGSAESSILFGNGDGTFQPALPYRMANFTVGSISVGDFNGDGVPDWAATDADSNTIGVMLSTPFSTISPASLNFGFQGVSTISGPRIVNISNPSNVNFLLTGIGATGNFAQTNDCPPQLTPGAGCHVSVTFSPTLTDLQFGAVSVTDDTRISPVAISLTGTGVNGPFLTLSGTRLTFAQQLVGKTGAAAAVTLVNTGNASMNIGGISITGPNSADFSQTNNCPGSLAAGVGCQVSVIFTPSVGGTRTASLAISDTAPGSPQTVVLSGVAEDFAIGPAPGTPTSQAISAGQSAAFSLVFSPLGGFNGVTNLSCGITPVVSPAPTCALSSSSVQLTGTGSQTVIVTVGTTAPVTTAAASHVDSWSGWPLLWVTLLIMGGVLLRNQERRSVAVAVLLIVLGAGIGCGGGGGGGGTVGQPHTTPGTPAGAYTVAVTASSSGVNHTMMLTVTVR